MVLGLPRRPKGEANRAVLITSRGLRFPLWKPLGDSAKAVQTAEKHQNTRSSRASPHSGVAIPFNRGKAAVFIRKYSKIHGHREPARRLVWRSPSIEGKAVVIGN